MTDNNIDFFRGLGKAFCVCAIILWYIAYLETCFMIIYQLYSNSLVWKTWEYSRTCLFKISQFKKIEKKNKRSILNYTKRY